MPEPTAAFPRRTVHLDFHNGPLIPGIGADFDPATFAQPFVDAAVDSVTVFAKCHHGLLYYGTDRPERHPGLAPDLDLLAGQVEALHAAGIRAPIYLSVQVDEWAAREHPEWVALDDEQRMVKWGGSAYTAGWHVLDMSSPYADHLAEQVEEVVRRFAPVDGVFLDMCWDQPSSSRWAHDGMRRAGLRPADAEDRKRYARSNALAYMRRYRDLVEKALPDDAVQGVWFNSRPKTNLAQEHRLLRHVEVEGLPTGGWGYTYLPYVARFVRPLGLPTLSHTGRFHESWGDNGGFKPQAAMDYECSQILSLGLTNGVGDVLPPRGVPSPAAYQRIGHAFRHVRDCEPFLEGGTSVAEVALLVDPELGDAPGPSGTGAVRALQQLRQQFDVVPPASDLSAYRVVVVGESTAVTPEVRAGLEAFRAAGGAVVLVGAALRGTDGEPSLADLPVDLHGPSEHPVVFVHREGSWADGLAADVVLPVRPERATARAGARVLARVALPYVDRDWDTFSGHAYAPVGSVTDDVLVAVGDRVVAVAAPLFEAFAAHGHEQHRELLGEALDAVLPQPLVRAGGPRHLETTVVRTPSSTVVHLLSYVSSRETPKLDLVHDAFPLVGAEVSLRTDAAPSRVHLEPAGQDLDVTWADGRAHVSVTTTDGHAMVVFDD
ncbi:hypothetical protein GTR02_12400 [Kineococcus sp. R8]|uniref:alpha-L-fucosidase n=1 Tax=Kineococcus siccus TaxID=2696567 RepID=UPI0014137114|nr:hypothetical protein [Kineococcus siccus]